MMRVRHLLPLFLSSILFAQFVIAGDDSNESRASLEIERLGGKITKDQPLPGRFVSGIDFSGNKKISDEHLQSLKPFKRLQALDLTSTQISDEGLKEIRELKSLVSLSLRGTKVTDAGMKELKGLKNLTSLNLIDTRITDDGLKELTSLENLTALHLSHTQFRGGGVNVIRETAGAKDLRSLILGPRMITNAGVKRLKEALPNLKVHQ